MWEKRYRIKGRKKYRAIAGLFHGGWWRPSCTHASSPELFSSLVFKLPYIAGFKFGRILSKGLKNNNENYEDRHVSAYHEKPTCHCP